MAEIRTGSAKYPKGEFLDVHTDGFSQFIEHDEIVIASYDMFPKQLEFVKDCMTGEYSLVLYGGSIRGGKSIGLMGLIDELRSKFPDGRYGIVKETRPQMQTVLMPKFWEVFDRRLLKQEPTVHNGNIAKFHNGFELVFMHENFDAQLRYLEDFKGLEVDGFICDEISGLAKPTFDKMLERIGTWKMKERRAARAAGQETPPALIAASCNPTANYLKRLVYDKYLNGTLPKHFKYIPSSVYDNPYVEQEWIDRKQSEMTPLQFELMVSGDWNATSNATPFFHYIREDSIAHILNKDENLPLILSFDFNIDSCACVILQYDDEKYSGLKVLGSHLVYGGIRNLCKVVKNTYLPHMERVLVTGDPTGASGHALAGVNTAGEKINSFKIIQEELEIPSSNFISFANALRNHSVSRDFCNQVFYKIPIWIDRVRAKQLWLNILKAKPKYKTSGRVELHKDRKTGYDMDDVDAFRYGLSAIFQSIENINIENSKFFTFNKPLLQAYLDGEYVNDYTSEDV